MIKVLRELVTSKKMITAVVGFAGIVAARYGFELDVEIVLGLIGMLSVLLGAQGATDFGKEAAKVNAAAAVTVADTNRSATVDSAVVAADSQQRASAAAATPGPRSSFAEARLSQGDTP
jgi:hypothetical protein